MDKTSIDEKDLDKEGDQTFDSHAIASSRKWEDVKPKDFKTQTVKFVVCLNTMGQDREFTADEIKFA